MNSRQPLFGLTLSQLQDVASQLGMPRFAAKQMADWLYKKNVDSIDQMTNISVKMRSELMTRYEVGRTAPTDVLTSVDGTRKYLFAYAENTAVETAYIPDADRHTLCVSSQFGCKMNCSFCMTGRQGFSGNLTAGQILNQLASIDEHALITNIVFMGMGEPMDNLTEVLSAVEVLTSSWGYAMSPRRITVSTIGIPHAVKQFLEFSEAHLAISLHSPQPSQRAELMPVQKAYPVEDVIALLRQYNWFGQRRLTFEYTMFDHVNDSPEHARQLVNLLRGLPCRVNLIGFNPIPNSTLRGTPAKRMADFRARLEESGLTATIRMSKGGDISAACGMLSTKKKQENEVA